MDLCNESCSASQPSCVARILTLDITHKMFNQISSYLPCFKVSLTSTILHHFHLSWPCLWVTTLAQSKTYWLHFLTHLSFAQHEIWCGNAAIEAEHPETAFEKVFEVREITAVLQTASKKHAFRFSPTWYDDRCYWMLHFIQSSWPWPWFMVTEVKESKKFCTSYLTKFSIDLNEFSWLLRLIISRHFSIQGTEPYLHDFVKENFSIIHSIFQGENPAYMSLYFNVGLYSHIYKLISFKLGMMIEITKLYILISVWMTWPSFTASISWEIKNFCILHK